MSTPDWHFMISDASTGATLAELPLTITQPITRGLNAVGQLQATLSADDKAASDDILGKNESGNTDREITAIRDDKAVWNGPVMLMQGSLRTRTINITANEPTAYYGKRALEMDKTFTAADLFDIWRWFHTYATTKDSSGTLSGGTSINAAIPRFTVSPASALAGVTKSLSYRGTDRQMIGDIYRDLIDDPTTSLDYRVDYSPVVSGTGLCQRTVVLGSPSLGITLPNTVTEHMLYDFDKTEDRNRAGNRAHTVGQFYTDTLLNATSIANGDILLDVVQQRGDLADTSLVQAANRDLRHRAIPPVYKIVATYVPNVNGLPFDWANPGDKFFFNVSGPSILHSTAHVRIAECAFIPPSGSSDEYVQLTTETSLDNLGT